MSQDAPKNLLAPPALGTPVSPRIQTLQSTGSATGNPRNKCALKPGHSLMDWVRLGNSGIDLSGTKGRIVPVTLQELAKHNTREDAWMAIRGVVYNVTRYMDFHPGGIEELMRGVGKDATKLFNDVHAWVNYQQLLNKCLIGPLKTTRPPSLVEECIVPPPAFNKPPLPPQDVVPRLDWTQSRSLVTLYFYTKQLCNPGCSVRRLQCEADASRLEILVLIDLYAHKYEFEMHGKVNWPPKELKIAAESGKIEIVLEKDEKNSDLWSELGKHSTKKILKNSLEEKYSSSYAINQIMPYNHDSYVVVLRNEDVVLKMPAAQHIEMEVAQDSSKAAKCYTPVPEQFSLPSSTGSELRDLHFIIKKYNHRNSFSAHVTSLPPGCLLKVSLPRGNFKLSALASHRCVCFLAAGSGITPFLSLLDHCLKRNSNRMESVKLFYFNKCQEDIWCREALADLAKRDERFECVHVLSAPSDTWTGESGHVSAQLLAPVLAKSASSKATYAAICGPPGFNQKVEELLLELEFNTANTFVF